MRPEDAPLTPETLQPGYIGTVLEFGRVEVRWCHCHTHGPLRHYAAGVACDGCGYWHHISERAREDWNVPDVRRPRDRECPECHGLKHSVACGRASSSVPVVRRTWQR